MSKKDIYSKILKYENIICLVIAFIHWLFSFSESVQAVFVGNIQENLGAYLLLKCVLYIILFFLWRLLFRAIFYRGQIESRIVLWTIPYLIILLVFLYVFPKTTLIGDELGIYNKVTNYDITPSHFTVFTGLVYGIPLMIIPSVIGIIIVKVVLQSLLCGYCIARVNKITESKKGALLYLFFLLPVVVLYVPQIHRMHWYGLLYLFFVAKLMFDYWENRTSDWKDTLIVMLLAAVLAIWRKEGIYLLVLFPIVYCIAYKINNIEKIAKSCVIFLSIFVLCYIPQLSGSFTAEESHTYSTYLVHMCRGGA